MHYNLSSVFLFSTLNQEQIKTVEAMACNHTVRQNEILFSDGQTANAFYIVVSGRLKIFKLSPDGLEQILLISKKGSLIAEAAIFGPGTYPAFCQAIEDSELIAIAKKEFLQFLLANPRVSIAMLHAYSTRLRYLVRKIEELSLFDIKTRLANYLIAQSRPLDGERVIVLDSSKKELASLLGTIPETLSRTLKFFKNEGVIEERKNRIIIVKPDRLDDFLIS